MGATVVSNGKLVKNCYECDNCQCVYYCNDTSNEEKIGLCSKSERHKQYTAEMKIEDTGSGESGWRFCTRCACVYLNSSATAGTCVGNTSHTPADVELTLAKSAADEAPKSGWQRCKKCACLFHK